MIKSVLPLLFLAASAALFWGVLDPSYAKVQSLKKDEKLFADALDNSKKLQELRDDLLEQYNSFPTTDLERLQKILPPHVDNVRLIRDIDGIAGRYGMALRSVSVSVDNARPNGEIKINNEKYGSITLNFSVEASYKTFLRFLDDLERSLRVVDIIDVSFSASEKDLYQYRMSIRTYWLK